MYTHDDEAEKFVDCHIHFCDRTISTKMSLSDLLQLQDDVNLTAFEAQWKFARGGVLTDMGLFMLERLLSLIGLIWVVWWALL